MVLNAQFDHKSSWDFENKEFWHQKGKRIAYTNLLCSIPCLLLAFSVWFIWSAVVTRLNSVGFSFTGAQLFTLAGIPGLSGATLRILYSFVIPVVGGKNWTVFSTSTLILPSYLIGVAVQDTSTSYNYFLFLALLCGFGGGNFASSMSNISFFFPKKLQGFALGLNAGIGNLGVSVLQFTIPFVITIPLFGNFGGSSQILKNGTQIWIQNGSFVWIIPVLFFTVMAFFFMDNLHSAKATISDQFVIFKRKHMYLTTWLYCMSFGSFIGYSAAFPLLIKLQFPFVDPLKYAFIGPMLGALIRPLGGWVSDKFSGSAVTLYDLFVMIFAVLGVIYYISPETKNFYGFFFMFLLLFFTTGVANGSVFQMIPMLFEKKESAAVLGFSSAIAAYGAFFIPKVFALSISYFNDARVALVCFIIYYFTCIVLTWWYYYRKGCEAKC